ncbi:MAG: hypothetical protein JWO08_2320 [Verrucomicrobiaceae bacterium]|nr:hypothetical protein [Verrucomicrobiaceae bacterium]
MRPAAAGDCELLWQWANEPAVRQAAFRTEPIHWENHQRWFTARLASPSTHIYLLEDADTRIPVGQVRYDEDEARPGYFSVDISVPHSMRGTGAGSMLLKMSEERLRREANVVRLLAEVKLHNVASLALFRRHGYEERPGAGPNGEAIVCFQKS